MRQIHLESLLIEKKKFVRKEILCNSILLTGCRIYYLLVLYIFVASKRDIFREN